MSVEHVHGGEQRRRAVAHVVVGHGSGAALLDRQPRLRPVERLDLTFLVEAEHDGVRGWIDIEPDDVAQFGDELRVVGKLELADTVRLQPMRAPDALNRRNADAYSLRHQRTCPVRRLAGRRLHRQFDDALGDRGREFRHARGPRLVAQQPIHALGGEAFLPAPDAGFRLAGLAHDGVCADPLGAQQHDLRPPNVLLRRVPVLNESVQPIKAGLGDGEGNASSHADDSHDASP